MPRRGRLVVPGYPLHIIQRGNNRHSCFFTDSDYQVYLDMLDTSARAAHCQVHAYVLMTNHSHLLISPREKDSPGKMMKSLGERYVQYVNQRYERVGTLWQGRFRSCLVADDAYLLICHRYIELNPVRAGMVSHPAHYKWSSFQSNANGAVNHIITPHALYEGLGATQSDRQRTYRDLFLYELAEDPVDQLRKATNSNFAFCNTDFAEAMASQAGAPLMRRKSGRSKHTAS